MKRFENKVIWVIGASSGFGEALAYAFAKEGANVILSARRLSELTVVHSKIVDSRILILDLLESYVFEEKVKEAVSFFGCIDMVVHCGGVGQSGTALETSEEVGRIIFDTNYFGVVELTRQLLPHFIERRKGHVVVVSGVLAKVGLPGRSSYCAAKAALHGYFDSLRAELARIPVDVTILIPSFLHTDLTKKALNGIGEQANKKPENKGCTVEKAARQAMHAVAKKKCQSYIGNRDKGRLLLMVNRWCPNLVFRLVNGKQ